MWPTPVRSILFRHRVPVPADAVAAIVQGILDLPGYPRNKPRNVLIEGNLSVILERRTVLLERTVLCVVVIERDSIRRRMFGRREYDRKYRDNRRIADAK